MQTVYLLFGCWDLWRIEKASTEAFSSVTLSFGVWGEVRTRCTLFAQKKEFSNTASPTGSSPSKKTSGKVYLPLPSTFIVSMDWRVRGSWEYGKPDDIVTWLKIILVLGPRSVVFWSYSWLFAREHSLLESSEYHCGAGQLLKS